MKNIISLVFIFAAISGAFLFYGCEKERDGIGVSSYNEDLLFNNPVDHSGSSGTVSNYFTHNGISYDIGTGLIYYYGPYISSYDVRFVLLSPDLVIDESTGEPVSGVGSYVYFRCYSSSSDLAPGTYVSDPDGSGSAGTFYYGFLVINYDGSTGDMEDYYYIFDGTVTVNRSGDKYIIDIDCTDEDGNAFSGYFYSTMYYYDESKEGSSDPGIFIFE